VDRVIQIQLMDVFMVAIMVNVTQEKSSKSQSVFNPPVEPWLKNLPFEL